VYYVSLFTGVHWTAVHGVGNIRSIDPSDAKTPRTRTGA
jgi:hypothetical protein